MKVSSPFSPELLEALKRLEITVGQVARLVGVTPRQINYWTERGFLRATREEGRAQYYGLSSIEKALFIKKFMDSGYTLETAAQEAEKVIEARRSCEAGMKASNGAAGELVIKDPSASYLREEGKRCEATMGRLSSGQGMHPPSMEKPEKLEERLATIEERLERLDEAMAKCAHILIHSFSASQQPHNL